ncbi:MAG: hypothetical protein JWN31_446 [Frankiales bacterium]|nr:hypothetical protein [Frankiales bacterium]
MTQSADLAAIDDLEETVLPTYELFARFAVPAVSEREAIDALVTQLTTAHEPFHEITVEREDPSGTWLVAVRFVIVSVDGHTAVLGLDETLRAAGLSPDEVWAGTQVA